MWGKNLPAIFLCGILAGGSILYWNQLVDVMLLPRLLFIAVWTLLFLPFAFNLLLKNDSKTGYADLFFIAFAALHYLSIIQAINIPEAVYEALRMTLILLCYLFFKRGLTANPASLNATLKTITVISAIYLVLGIVQMKSLLEVTRPEGDNLYSISSLAGHKNHFSCFMMLTSYVLLIAAIRWKGYWKMAALIITVLQLAFIFMLQTRAVFLGILFSLLVMAVITVKHKLIPQSRLIWQLALAGAAIIMVVAVFGVYTGSIQAFARRMNLSNFLMSDTGIERLSVWYKSSLLLKEHWLLGVGGRNWMLIYPKYSLSGMFRMQYLQTVFLQPHNDYLWIWCELGIAGLIAFLGIFIAFFKNIFSALKNSAAKSDSYILVLLAGALSAYMVFAFFDFPKERTELQVLWVFILALTAVFAPAKTLSFSVKVPAPIVKTVLGGLLVLIVFTLGARTKAESFEKEMRNAEAHGDNKTMLELATTMQTPFATVDHNGDPKMYHEGIAAYGLGDYNRAYTCFLKAYTISPYNFNVLNNLGGMETYFKNYDKALTNYKEALRINPRNDDTRFNIAYTLYFLHRYDEALDSLKPVWSNLNRKHEFDSIINAAKIGAR